MRRFAQATRQAFVAIIGGTAAIALWLSLLDRIGVVLVGGDSWCGLKGLWLIFCCHAATALPVVATVLAVRSLPGWLTRGPGRFLVRFAGVAGGFTVGKILFLELPLNNVIPTWIALVMPLVGAIAGGYATTFDGSVKLKRWQLQLASGLSFVAAIVDATVFPTLVEASHVRVHVITVAAGVIGIGVPAGILLAARRERWVPATALVIALAAVHGVWFSLAKARGFVSAASPMTARSFRLLPLKAPRRPLRLMLAQPPRARKGPPPVRASAPPRAAKSVILITVDALRADALRPGAGRGTYMKPGDTPFVDRWLTRAAWFDTAYSQGTSTVDALHSLMGGINPDDPHAGADVPAIARHLGLESLAVIPPMLREDHLFQTGLARFDRVELYDLERQEQQMDHVVRLLSERDGEPFFLWTHFFATHLPCYSLSGPRAVEIFTPPTAVNRLTAEYREAVRWLDAQLARLERSLDEQGLRDSTLIVLTADHGEHVADGLIIGHGEGHHEADMRVPLIIDVPRWPRTTIPTIVGSRDVLPTIVELLGSDPEPAQRGTSLVPLIQGERPREPRTYPVRGFGRAGYALIHDGDVLVYPTKLATFQRFPRVPGVTTGRGDVFGRDPRSDEQLLALLAEYEAFPFLGDAWVPQVLARRIAELDGLKDPGWIDALLRAAQHVRTPEVTSAIEFAYGRFAGRDDKLRFLTGAFTLDVPLWSRHLEALVRQSSIDDEAALVRAIERAGLGRGVSTDLAVERLSYLRGAPRPELQHAWLSILPEIQRGPALLGELIWVSLTMDLQTAPRSDVLELLHAIEALSLPKEGRDAATLADRVRPLVASGSERIARAACLALGAIGNEKDADEMARLVREEPRTPVRRAAIRATARLRGAAAKPSLREWTLIPDIASAAFTELGRIRDGSDAGWLKAELDRETSPTRTAMIRQTQGDLHRRSGLISSP